MLQEQGLRAGDFAPDQATIVQAFSGGDLFLIVILNYCANCIVLVALVPFWFCRLRRIDRGAQCLRELLAQSTQPNGVQR